MPCEVTASYFHTVFEYWLSKGTIQTHILTSFLEHKRSFASSAPGPQPLSLKKGVFVTMPYRTVDLNLSTPWSSIVLNNIQKPPSPSSVFKTYFNLVFIIKIITFQGSRGFKSWVFPSFLPSDSSSRSWFTGEELKIKIFFFKYFLLSISTQ